MINNQIKCISSMEMIILSRTYKIPLFDYTHFTLIPPVSPWNLYQQLTFNKFYFLFFFQDQNDKWFRKQILMFNQLLLCYHLITDPTTPNLLDILRYEIYDFENSNQFNIQIYPFVFCSIDVQTLTNGGENPHKKKRWSKKNKEQEKKGKSNIDMEQEWK